MKLQLLALNLFLWSPTSAANCFSPSLPNSVRQRKKTSLYWLASSSSTSVSLDFSLIFLYLAVLHPPFASPTSFLKLQIASNSA
jgi:hypothetical protein